MKSFTYIQPKTLKEASKMLVDNKKALIYAGGTDTLDLIKHDIIDPDCLVNLKPVAGLAEIRGEKETGISIGALTSVADVASNKIIREFYPVLAEAADEITVPQLKNMGTVGGNICQRPRCWYYREDFNCLRKGGDTCYAFTGENKYHCIVGGGPCYIVHPSDLAVALLALGAELVITNGKKNREVPLKEFFILPEKDYTKENILETGEIISEILLPPVPQKTKSGYLKFKERGAWDFAVVSAGAVIKREGGKITEAKVSFGGIAPVPWQVESFNSALKGLSAPEDIRAAADKLFKEGETLDKNGYKVILVRNITCELIQRLLEA